jgi:hypothetical protein
MLSCRLGDDRSDEVVGQDVRPNLKTVVAWLRPSQIIRMRFGQTVQNILDSNPKTLCFLAYFYVQLQMSFLDKKHPKSKENKRFQRFIGYPENPCVAGSIPALAT